MNASAGCTVFRLLAAGTVEGYKISESESFFPAFRSLLRDATRGLWVFGSTLGCLVSEAAKVSVFRDVRVPVRLDAPNAWERERERDVRVRESDSKGLK